jgi:mRNA interferase MazF
MTTYVPARGDFIVATFEPQAGHEQRGRRPALVVSHTAFNRRTGLAIVCPLTRTARGFPFHVPVTGNPEVAGFVMVEQVKSVDYRARRSTRVGQASGELLDQVLSVLDACLY